MKYTQGILMLIALSLSALSVAQTTRFADLNPPPGTGIIAQIDHDQKLMVIYDDIYRIGNGMVVYAAPDSLLQVDPDTLAAGTTIAYRYKGKGNKRTLQEIWILPASQEKSDRDGD